MFLIYNMDNLYTPQIVVRIGTVLYKALKLIHADT